MITFLSSTALPTAFAATPVAVAQTTGSGQGFLTFLQGLACVMVSLAALVYIIRAIRCERREAAACSVSRKAFVAATLESEAAQPLVAGVSGGSVPAVAPIASGGSAASVAAGQGSAALSSVTTAASAPALSDATQADDLRMGAVVAAAVHTAMQGRPHRIVRIYESSHGWAQEGRREIFSSKRVR